MNIPRKRHAKQNVEKVSKPFGIQQGAASSGMSASQIPDENSVVTWRYKDFFDLVKAFVNDNEAHELSLPPKLSGNQRKDLHRIAAIFELDHKSHGSASNRVLKLTKPLRLLQGQESTINGTRIKKFEGFQGAQVLKNCPSPDQSEESINLMKKYWHNMCETLRTEPGRLQRRNKRMCMLQGGLSTAPSYKRDESRYQSLQRQRQALPTFARRNDIVNTLSDNDVVIVCGATGCGKTTQVPQIIFDAHIFPSDSIIVCTQPRRISALSVACRVAEERGEACGDTCGYVIRFENKTSPNTRIVYETTGILLRHLHTEPELNGVSCVIVDEVHERDVETDFSLLLLKDRLLAQRQYPDEYPTKLKLVVMSATVKIETLVKYFSGVNSNSEVPLISIEGTLFPVDEYFLEDAIRWVGVPATSVPAMGLLRNNANTGKNNDGDDTKEQTLYEKLRDTVFNDVERDAEATVPYELICKLIVYLHEKERSSSGSILVFLPGWAAITRVQSMLYRLPTYRELYILMLHSSLTSSEQQRVFLPAPKRYRKVVLATSIAETSITIDDVIYVIDSGLVKGTLYDPSSNLSSLKATLIAKANGKQRRGRAGRCQAGVCVHLLPASIYDSLEDFLPPEMMRSPLEEVCLQLKAIHLTERCEAVLARAMDPPPVTSVRNAVQFLTDMGALTSHDEMLTNLGYALAQIPVHPLLGKMLFASACFGVLDSVTTIAAGLSVKTLFVKPQASEKTAVRETMKILDNNDFSDHLCSLKIYREWLRSGRSCHYATEHFADQSALHTLDRTKQQLINLVLRSPLLRRLKNPTRDASRHDGNTGLVRLVVLWSLYPRIASIEFLAKRRDQIPKVVCWDNKPSVFTMSSVLAFAKRGDLESRTFVMYYERMQLESALTLFDSSCISPLDVALCVNQLSIYPLSEVPNSILLGPESKMGPSSPLIPDLINDNDSMAMFFDGGKKMYVTTKQVARALKMARSCMDYYLALSIKKLRSDIFPQDLVRAIAMLIGYPLSDLESEINTSIANAPKAIRTLTDDSPMSAPSFVRGYNDVDSSDSEAEDNMIEVESGDEFDEPLALTADQKKCVTVAFGNLAVIRDDEAPILVDSAQDGDLPDVDKLVSGIKANVEKPNMQNDSKEQGNEDDEEAEEEEEDIIIAKPGELVIS
ncbi:unnamed protein product [Phytomonas sp. EM1]|nr:unnamed protein product [Phytomonas sp. EM1]|eukprot:CCW61993.1 unnamed protein product [Phytomonas sp. isolate EM1]